MPPIPQRPLVLAALTLASLIFAAQPSQAGQRSKVFDADYDRTWEATLAALEGFKVPLTTTEKGNGLIRGVEQWDPPDANQWVKRYTTQPVRALSGWHHVQVGLTLVISRRGARLTEVKVETELAAYNEWTEIWRSLETSGAFEGDFFDAIQNRLNVMSAGSSSPSPAGDASAGSMGTVHLSSKPAEADVEVDGSFVGQTPADLSLPPGKHEIRVSKHGFAPWKRTLEVLPGATTSLAASLAKPQS